MKVMAEKMGMDASTFSQFVNSPNPSIPTLERIANVLHVNIGDLFDRKYEQVSGFLATGKESIIVNSKEDWAIAAQKIDGLAKPPLFIDISTLRQAIELFVIDSMKKKKNAVIMAQLGADEIITLIAEVEEEYIGEQDILFRLVTCHGNGVLNLYRYSAIENHGDYNGMIEEICNDIESLYEDKDYGKAL